MTRPTALPFTLRRASDVIHQGGIVSTTETVHGLLRVGGESVTIQWRVHRAIDRYGRETRSDQEVEPVREVSVSLADLGGAEVRRPWWAFGRKPSLILTAASLEAFEALAGPAGLQLDHPARLEVQLRREDFQAGQMFAADLALAIGEGSLQAASEVALPSRPHP
jgi:hypothetical protein